MTSAARRTNNQLVPMDSGSACGRPGLGLVSWWQAEGDASDSRGNNPGVPVNGAPFYSGMVGQAFLLDGSSQAIEIPYSPSLATPSCSIECWVNPSAQPAEQAFVYGQSYGRQLVVEPGEVGVWVALFITDVDGNFYGVRSTDELPIAGWAHLAGTWDGTYLNLYTNGVLAAQGAPGFSDIGVAACPFSIGAGGSCGPAQYFPGLIDEVSVYGRALFPGEINAIYQAGSAGKCKTPAVCAACPASVLSWWPAEGDASDTVGSNPGTPQNGVGFPPGVTGQAFSFNGIDQGVEVPYSAGMAASAF